MPVCQHTVCDQGLSIIFVAKLELLMKKLLLLLALFGALTVCRSQVNRLRNETSRTIKKDTDTSTWTWKRGGLISFNLAQGSVSNWAAGGDNFSLSVNGYLNSYFYYKKDRQFWDNNLDINMGYVQSSSLGGRKNDDRFDFLSKNGYRIDSIGKWYVSSLFNLRSQFFDGYTYSGPVADFASSFLSPAYFILSAGFDYKPNERFSVFLSPLTSRLTLVANQTLSSMGKYGVPAGKHAYHEMGTFITVNYNSSVAKNINYKGRYDMFSNYYNNPWNIDLFMTNLFTFKINKFFSATYSLDLIYDDDVRLFGGNNDSPALQTKSLIGIGFLKPLNVRKG